MCISLYFRSELAVGFPSVKQSFQLLREQNFCWLLKRRQSYLQMEIQCKTPLTSMRPRCRSVTWEFWLLLWLQTFFPIFPWIPSLYHRGIWQILWLLEKWPGSWGGMQSEICWLKLIGRAITRWVWGKAILLNSCSHCSKSHLRCSPEYKVVLQIK